MDSTDRIADAILALINSRPRTPTREEIAAVLAQPQPEAATDDELDECTAWPALEVSFSESNDEFVKTTLPWVRLAFDLMIKTDSEQGQQAIAALLDDGHGEHTVAELLENWERVARKLAALAKALEIAHTRAVLAACVVTDGKRPCVFMDIRELSVG
jgi:hypothetical protein